MKTVLLVGHQPDSFTNLVALLEEQGFTTLLANRDFEAIQLVQQHEPDMVIYDVTHSRTNGKAFHFMLQIRPRTAQIPLLFLAHLEDWKLPEVHYLEKPVSDTAIVTMVKHILRRRAVVSQPLRTYSSIA